MKNPEQERELIVSRMASMVLTFVSQLEVKHDVSVRMKTATSQNRPELLGFDFEIKAGNNSKPNIEEYVGDLIDAYLLGIRDFTFVLTGEDPKTDLKPSDIQYKDME